MIALDTNILLHLANEKAPEYSQTRAAIVALETRGERLCTASQNLIEFWAVATRSAGHNSLGMSCAQAAHKMGLIEDTYFVLRDDPRIFGAWRDLVLEHDVRGKQVHDTRLAAAYRVNGIERVLTINVKDFQRFPFLECFAPNDVISGTLPV